MTSQLETTEACHQFPHMSHVIYTKSGGIHGIRNPAGNAQPLKFVAFGYSAS